MNNDTKHLVEDIELSFIKHLVADIDWPEHALALCWRIFIVVLLLMEFKCDLAN